MICTAMYLILSTIINFQQILKCHKACLFKLTSSKVISRSVWSNIALGQQVKKFPVQCWPIAKQTTYQENNLYIQCCVDMLGQHCIRILSSQCCPNMSEATRHKKSFFAVLAQSTQSSFCRNTGCSFKYVWQPF